MTVALPAIGVGSQALRMEASSSSMSTKVLSWPSGTEFSMAVTKWSTLREPAWTRSSPCSPDGELLVQAGSRSVDHFVTAMLNSVPDGQESTFVDFDDELASILSA